MDRRNFFGTSAAVAGTSLAACASATMGGGSAVRTPFAVPGTTIPIVGSAEVFPVRRIYCIGRNY
jgi:hypothetical protein